MRAEDPLSGSVPDASRHVRVSITQDLADLIRAGGEQNFAAGRQHVLDPAPDVRNDGVEHEAASNSRTLGLQPAATMSERVTFSVYRLAA
jgi:hypothetical protein